MGLLSKTLLAGAVLSFFTLGLVSVSFATRLPSPTVTLHYGKFHRSLKDRLPQMDKKTLNSGMLFEENGERPNPPIGQTAGARIAANPNCEEKPSGEARASLNPKVSTCIFQSALNL